MLRIKSGSVCADVNLGQQIAELSSLEQSLSSLDSEKLAPPIDKTQTLPISPPPSYVPVPPTASVSEHEIESLANTLSLLDKEEDAPPPQPHPVVCIPLLCFLLLF